MGTPIVDSDVPVQADPDTIRRTVERVFADPAYDDALNPAVVEKGFIQGIRDILDAIWDAFWDLSEWMYNLHTTSPILFWVLLATVLVVLFLLIWHISYTVRMTVSAIGRGRWTPEEMAEEERVILYRELRREADERARMGDFPGAIRQLLLALFARFEESRPGAVPEGWTNHEVVARARVDDLHRDRLQDLVLIVDRVWYGRQAATSADFRHAATVVDSVAWR